MSVTWESLEERCREGRELYNLRSIIREEIQEDTLPWRDAWRIAGSIQDGANRVIKSSNGTGFNLRQYCAQSFTMHMQRGFQLGKWFSMAYGNALEVGLTGSQFYHWVREAEQQHGKLFARWYTWGLPEAVERGISPDEYMKILWQGHCLINHTIYI